MRNAQPNSIWQRIRPLARTAARIQIKRPEHNINLPWCEPEAQRISPPTTKLWRFGFSDLVGPPKHELTIVYLLHASAEPLIVYIIFKLFTVEKKRNGKK